jgi:DNA polymerase-3 subunit alpha
VRGENNYLRHLTYKGAEKRYPELSDDIKERLDFELLTISNSGYPGYFLIVQDIVDFVRRKSWLPGPGRGCFTPDTPVIMSDRSKKAISSIQIGDRVLDCNGESQKVTNTLEFDVNEDILELEFGNKVVRCTKDHKFFTNNRGWVQAQDLTAEDDVKEI